MKTVTAADANRHFSCVLRDVSQGEIATVASRGRPVATIAPARSADTQRAASRATLIARLHKQEASGERNWTREEIYDRDL